MVAKPETILAWYRRVIAQKFDGSKHRSYPGRPAVTEEAVQLVVRMARENRAGGTTASREHSPILATKYLTRRLGTFSADTASHPLRNGADDYLEGFIAAHMAVLVGANFFTAEVLTWRGLATYYVLFLVQMETRRVTLAGWTMHPTESWMEQMARNAADPENGHLRHQRYVLHDRHTKFCSAFSTILKSDRVKCLALTARSPNLNAFAEGWVRSVKQELTEYVAHYHPERNHLGKS